MAEEMTYEPVTDWRKRVQELERENAELRAKLDTVPDYVDYRRGCNDFDLVIFSFDEWYERIWAVQP